MLSRRAGPGNNGRSTQAVTAGSGPSNTVSIDTATNRVTGMGAATFYHDANGNLTQDDLYKYKYDAENRLVEIRQLDNTLLGTHSYDGKSLRVLEVMGSTRYWWIYAGSQLISESSDNASTTYTAGTTPGQAPAESQVLKLYQHTDRLSTRVTTDNQGQTANQQGHYPFGESWYDTGAASSSVMRKFTTYMPEGEATTGKLNYAVFREHSSRIGRFHMADPVRGRIANPQRLNRYAYVINDPTNRRDPRGQDDWLIGVDFGGGGGWYGGGGGGYWDSWGDPNWVYGIPVGGGWGGWGGDAFMPKPKCEEEYRSCLNNLQNNLQTAWSYPGCTNNVDKDLATCFRNCASVWGDLYDNWGRWRCDNDCQKEADAAADNCFFRLNVERTNCLMRKTLCLQGF